MNTQKIAVIVGSTHGIGLACTKKFLDSGFKVIGVSRGITDDRGSDMEKTFKNYKHFYFNISDEIDVKEFFGKIENPNIVLICAGIGIAPTAIDNFNLSEVENVIKVNLIGAASVMKYALPKMLDGFGCLALCGSIATDDPKSGADWSYSSSKAALIPLLKFATQDKRFERISFLHLKLGFIETRMTVADDKKAWLLKTPYAKVGNTSEIAERIFFSIMNAIPGYSEISLIGGNLPDFYPKTRIVNRRAGVLAPIFSLPNSYACGSLGEESREFIQKISASGFGFWLMLPLNPTGISNSPYCPQSIFAGNINFISLDDLYKDGLLSKNDLTKFKISAPKVDYGYCYKMQPQILHKAWKNFISNSDSKEEFKNFCEENFWWLEDYAIFFAIKEKQNGIAFQDWSNDLLKLHDPESIKKFVEKNNSAIEFWKWTQYIFFKQLKTLIEFAHYHEVNLIGDLPFYVNADSVETWAHRELFEVDEKGTVKMYAGTPHEDNRHWGVSAYKWGNHAENGFKFWRKRISFWGKFFDGLRIDHATGLLHNYIIPADGTKPRFENAPSDVLLQAIDNEAKRLGVAILAEDLGKVPDSFRQKLYDMDWFCMRIMQYAYKTRYGVNNVHLPLNFNEQVMVFTGTHDNTPLREFISNFKGEDLEYAMFILGAKNCDELRDRIIQNMYFSKAKFCTLPIQDILNFGKESNLVYHEHYENSWKWRLDNLSRLDLVSEKMYALAVLSGRLSDKSLNLYEALEVMK